MTFEVEERLIDFVKTSIDTANGMGVVQFFVQRTERHKEPKNWSVFAQLVAGEESALLGKFDLQSDDDLFETLEVLCMNGDCVIKNGFFELDSLE